MLNLIGIEKLGEHLARGGKLSHLNGVFLLEQINALVAQRIERQPSKLDVEGSSPSERTTNSALGNGPPHNSGERLPKGDPATTRAETFSIPSNSPSDAST